jgi:hypothetical protein
MQLCNLKNKVHKKYKASKWKWITYRAGRPQARRRPGLGFGLASGPDTEPNITK